MQKKPANTKGGGGSIEMSYLCPCSVFYHCHGAPEPHRCLWRHRWELQPWRDLGDTEDISHFLLRSAISRHRISTKDCLDFDICWNLISPSKRLPLYHTSWLWVCAFYMLYSQRGTCLLGQRVQRRSYLVHNGQQWVSAKGVPCSKMK